MNPLVRASVRPRIHAVEEWQPVPLGGPQLSADGRIRINRSVLDGGLVEVRREGVGLRAYAQGHVGVIPLTDEVVLVVRPRVPVTNLATMMAKAGVAPSLLDLPVQMYEESTDPFPSYLDIMARAFIREVELVVARGLFREYQPRGEVTSQPRGRIVFRPTIDRQARGERHRVFASWFERTADNPVNRCLKYVLWLLSMVAKVDPLTGPRPTTIASLNALYLGFDAVHLDRERRFLTDGRVQGTEPMPTPRHYYSPALAIARAVLRREFIRIDRLGDAVEFPPVTLDMSDLFEDYVRAVLAERAAPPRRVLNGNVDPPAGGRKLLLDRGSSRRAQPDVVAEAPGADIPLVILEVKYKPADAGIAREDLNQAIAYGVSYRSNAIVVVRPRPAQYSGPRHREIGRVGPIVLWEYVFDLAGADLEAEETAFSTAVERIHRGLPIAAA